MSFGGEIGGEMGVKSVGVWIGLAAPLLSTIAHNRKKNTKRKWHLFSSGWVLVWHSGVLSAAFGSAVAHHGWRLELPGLKLYVCPGAGANMTLCGGGEVATTGQRHQHHKPTAAEAATVIINVVM